MIISLKDDFDRELGTSLPMISRAGQSTIPHHLCFSNAPGNKKEFNFSKKNQEKDEDLALLLGDSEKTDLVTEMKKIEEAERRKQPGYKEKKGKKGQSQANQTKTSAGFFIPFQ